MAYMVCVEENDRRWIAHVPDLPGCYTAHTDREKAIQAVPQTVDGYIAWCAGHGLHISGLAAPMIVAEVVRCWEFEDGYDVNAFFASDRPPIHEQELPEYRHLLQATRKDLLASVDDLSSTEMWQEFGDERWPIGGILGHVARAEWWYLDRLGLAFPREELLDEPLDCLALVRAHLLENLPLLAKRSGVVMIAGETWSARKLMRRTLWHERDHTEHITKLRSRIAAQKGKPMGAEGSRNVSSSHSDGGSPQSSLDPVEPSEGA
jgi:predicted RNase H-like HicB family nuclease